MTPAPAQQRELSSLTRGLEIIDAVQRAGRMRAADLSEQLDLPLSTVYRYLKNLRESGFLIDVDGYMLPSQRLAEPGDESDHLVSYAAPVLAHMRDKTGMTALLTVRIHAAAVCLEASFAHPKHKISFQRGQIRALYAGASALPLLAFAPDQVVQEVLDGEFRRFTSSTPQRRETELEIERVQKDGYSVSYGHLTPGMVAIGVPVIVDGRCMCALSLVGEPAALAAVEQTVATLRTGAAELLARMPKKTAREAWLMPDDAENE